MGLLAAKGQQISTDWATEADAVRHEDEPVEVIKVLNPRIDPEELAGT